MTKQQELSKAFTTFLEAQKNLSELWVMSKMSDQFSELYPFDVSFDELTVLIERWVNDAVIKLNQCHIHNEPVQDCYLCFGFKELNNN